MPTPHRYDLSDKTKQTVASHLRCDLSAISWHRFANSYANYVFRAEANGSSVIIKASDNHATINNWEIPAEHILNEFLFLKAVESIQLELAQFPKAIAYIEDDNALVMSDLGKAKWLMQGGLPMFMSKERTFTALGQLLAEIHEHEYPAVLMDSLQGSRVPEAYFDFKLGIRLCEDFDYLGKFLNAEPQGLTLLDYSPRNTLRTKPLGVFDFDFLSLGHQYYDLNNFLHFGLWISFLRKSKKLAMSLELLLTSYCDARTLDIHPEQWYADTDFLTWLLSLFYKKYNRKKNRNNEEKMRDYLRTLCMKPVNSWEELVDDLFIARKWL